MATRKNFIVTWSHSAACPRCDLRGGKFCNVDSICSHFLNTQRSRGMNDIYPCFKEIKDEEVRN